MSVVRLATRESPLALAQARLVASLLEARLGVRSELLPLRTTGDRLPGRLDRQGGKGLFVKEIEEAVLAGRADVAVHSAKDLPAAATPGLTIAAVPERADPRDALVARGGVASLAALPPGACVGTGSARRAAQLLAARPDLRLVPLRGNVGTRLRRLEEAELAAVVLACAGLERLGLAERISERIAPELLLPAVNQGALALQALVGSALASDLRALADTRAEAALRAERGFLERVGGDCFVPIAALAECDAEGGLRLRGLIAATDGTRIARGELSGPAREAAALGQALAERVLAAGGDAILAELREAERA